MSNQIRIRFAEVASSTSRIRNSARLEITTAETAYRHIQTDLELLDGAANAGLIRTSQLAQRKAQAAGEVVDRIALFVDLSARQVDTVERGIAAKLSQISISR